MLNPAQLARIDVSLLVVFSTVLEERQVMRAADRLNLTPSAVSHGLRRLRRIFHDPLFLKTPSGVKPTERALALAGPVAELLARLDAIVSATAPFDARTARRSFTIGAPDALAAVFLGSLLEILGREAAGIDIRLLQLMPQRQGKSSSEVWQDTLTELDSHRLDLAVLPTGPLPSRYAERLLFEEDFVVAMRKRHRMARKVTLAAYLAAPHLLVSAIGDALGIVDVRLAERGHSRRVALTVPNFMMALAQLAESDFIATLPRHLVERHAARFDLVMRPVPFPWTPDSVRVVASQAAIADAGVAWLFETVARCIGAVSRSAPKRRVSA
ncbi:MULTISPECIES: LysR family transcriptional regulator [unclassified Bradyrhizobium]|uniref:LysR family transcriptional regulator n=1 Tax=unclassified Bradyrhizobium TaxID=2631580 RepID=UPI00211DCB46|nr:MULTISPECIES: LysR family transcriptional regulator [unclassified Bradyrhizobium]MDD1537268.1 LysR family transcriptional regulator [Bradyrhizobium sp. WBOS8]MDD1586804.1 LysR family transcriptional regulator [Bradyrhizobium sp. WBOS4]UUO45615.1 LysR family transcriptional regulator [Bradyrhizobium sp. WBOS04]UUO59231.1 LysR family transcriptional regulator [Bradyrhizobium sp. WBOS08]